MLCYWVYMLRCCDDSFYIGVTNNLTMRQEEHYSGFTEDSYTQKRLPVELVYSRIFEYVEDAIAWEKKIKRWTRAKKEALIAMDGNRLHELAECKNESHFKNAPPSPFGSAQGDTDEPLVNDTK